MSPSATSPGNVMRITLSMAALGAGVVGGAWLYRKLVDLQVPAYFKAAPVRELGTPPSSAATDRIPGRSKLLIVALDGVGRRLLYDMLETGQLPGLARLLHGKQNRTFPHAFFHPSLLGALPAATSTNWASLFTGVTPAGHGVAGNEFFIRERARFVAPIPVTSQNPKPIMSSLVADYTDELLTAPTIYQQWRRAEPGIRIWVSLHMLHAGADRFLLTPRLMLSEFGSALWKLAIGQRRQISALFEKADRAAIDLVIRQLGKHPPPDVLTLYCPGTDMCAHKAAEGPEQAVRRYLKEVLDDKFAALHDALKNAGELDHRFVAVVSDHGQSPTHNDTAHALVYEADKGASGVLRRIGFRVRPFDLEIPDEHAFQCIIGNQQAFSYIYLANRSACRADGSLCDWSQPPRFQEDVLAAAEAFHQANASGTHDPSMRGTIDLILVRRPRLWSRNAAPFMVYLGQGRMESIHTFLRKQPQPGWLAFERRMKQMAEGKQGHRAGDVVLLAHWGKDGSPDQRYYFSHAMHSAHGGPTPEEGEIPLILAHPGFSARKLEDIATSRLGRDPLIHDAGRLLLHLRTFPARSVRDKTREAEKESAAPPHQAEAPNG